MNIIGIIPARYASTRFPGKPLADIHGKPMIQHVYEATKKALEHAVVATDDDRIYAAVKEFGGDVVMTSENHKTGTDRCLEAAEIIEKDKEIKFDIVLNIQGDEPQLKKEQITKLISCFDDKATEIATLVKKFGLGHEIHNPNNVKVVFNMHNFAMYFSRSVIPFNRNVLDKETWSEHYDYYKHIGIYAFRRNVLSEITQIEQSSIEKVESLEQIRWLENGYKIKVSETDFENIGVDTPEDLKNLISSGGLR